MPRSQERLLDRGYPTSDNTRRPRLISTIANKTNAAGAVSVSVAAAFTNGVPAGVFSASGLPTGLSINSATGLVTGTATAGVFSAARVSLRNGVGVAYSNTFSWTITE